jgi:hypothetical protein
MSLLVFLNRGDVCRACPLRKALVTHLKDKNRALIVDQLTPEMAKDRYNATGCAVLMRTPDIERRVEYDFSTRSDAPCKQSRALHKATLSEALMQTRNLRNSPRSSQ